MSQHAITSERWLPVPGYEGRYDVSDEGRVRSLESGRGTRKIPLILKPDRNRDGHLRVTLSIDLVTQRFFVHQLVLLAFVGPCPGGMQACHWDDVPSNNYVGNLRWDTPSANAFDSIRNGRRSYKRGAQSSFSKLTAADVKRIRADHNPPRVTSPMLGSRYGVAASTIRSIVNRRNWKHVL